MYGYNLGLAKARVSESIPAAPANIVLPSLVGNGAVGTIVTCSSGAWSGSPSPTFTFNFKLDTISVQSGSSNTYTALIGDDTKTLTCTVTATNTEGSANADTSNSLVIGTVPSNTVAPVISGTNTFGSTLTTTNGTFTGTTPLTYTYQWLRGGSPITGETLSTYVIGASDSLAAITCEVKATNTYGFDSEVSNTITIQDFAPINTVAPTVSPSGTQSTGTLITANVGTWTGVSPITYEYKWTRNGVAISGATASTYTIQVADDLTTIRVEVKGTNAYGVSGFVASSNSVSAVNVVAPTNSVAPVISGTTVVGQTLTSTTGTWSGIPTPTYSYQWKRGITNIGTNASTYTLVSADAGQSITCVVTATNSAGSGNATSNALIILATLLDVYPSATAAYSVRLLRGAYLGSPAIRVRRSNDNAELNIGFATSGNLDTSALTTFVGANSGFIVTWFDQSGNANNATQSTPANQPRIVNAGVIDTINSKTSFRFDGTNDSLQLINTITPASGIYTACGIGKRLATANSFTIFGDNTTSAATLLLGQSTINRYYLQRNTGYLESAIDSTANQMLLIGISASTNQLRKNATLLSNSLIALSIVNSIKTIGQYNIAVPSRLSGDLQEAIIWSQDQTANITGIESNVNTYYGIY